ncbi:NosD domain-containing protein, partial [Methanosarcina sp. 2.H.T.1A.15]|uniref:NosD domain-containing protein n=1 Tax=Methanosarcina sp. 2.H.T.1A.15 TaxID=1483596 RepID=UPI000622654D
MALALQVITGYAAATEFYVGDDGPGNYTTIQEALKDAVDGDIILVSPGTYPDETIFVNKSVTIKGAAGAEYPSVGGFSLLRHSRIEGLTITKGVDFSEGGVSCTIRNNRFNGCGVSMGTSYMYGNQTIMNNLFMGSPVGVSTYDSIDNKITGNTFRECDIGITLTYGAGGHIVTGNIIKNCGIGLYIIRDSASVYNNYFLNDVNLLIEDGNPGGSFSVPNMPGLNIIGGPYIGGNFWGSPAGAGFSQIHLDANGDGFAEEPYSLNEQNIDYLPLVTPRTEPVPVPPVADFTANPTSGSAPLPVQFTDRSQNATSRSWKFGDGATSSDTNPTHSYYKAGNYTVNLTVSNLKGTDSKTAVITVLEENVDN